MLKSVAKRILPAGVRSRIHAALDHKSYASIERQLLQLEKQAETLKEGDIVECFGYKVRINDASNYVTLVRDIFFRRIYHFETRAEAPFILDCGSNIGMSVLYFKMIYPQARIVGYEPDPATFALLSENIEKNNLNHVEIIHAALSDRETMLELYSDGKYGSYIGDLYPADHLHNLQKEQVKSIRLKDRLQEPVDFLKMNIEGAECEVLLDCGDSLQMVRELVIEYHHLPGLPRTLHVILTRLHDLGFEYLINDFSSEENPGVTPPFQLSSDSRYYLLVYAKRNA